jgi:CelD/BcsL family acetyltransferase involved in cellulose biosynthesis
MNTPEVIDPDRFPQWDHFVKSHPLGQIYHLAGWKTVLERSFGHIKGRYFVIREDASPRISAGLPVYEVHSWLTGRRIVAAPFATLFDPLVNGPGQLHPLLDHVLALAKESRSKYVEIRTLSGGAGFADRGFGEARYFLYHAIDLDRPLEAIWKTFHRTCIRQRVTRAEKSGLTFVTAGSKDGLQKFYRLFVLTRKRKSLPAQPYRFMEALWDVFQPSGNLMLMLAEKEGRPLAGLLLLCFRDRVSAEYLASDDSYNSFSPVHGLFWQAIQWAHGAGYKVFDFGRTSPANASLLEFKNRWGAAVRELPSFYFPAAERARLAQPEKNWKYSAARFMCSKMVPFPIRKLVGDFSYRHLG